MILIVDFGSQYNQLIARCVREAHVYCQIVPPDIALSRVRELGPEGVILSGGPSSVYEKNSPHVDRGIFDLGIPVLGICYGMQYMVAALGGGSRVRRSVNMGLLSLPSNIIRTSSRGWIGRLPAG